MNFDARAYWEARLSANYSLGGVGDIRMPLSYNKLLYALRRRAFRKAMGFVELERAAASVLDIGSGSGFYIEQWKKEAAHVTGSDITATAVTNLRSLHPDCSFLQWDAGSEEIPLAEKFDAVSAFDVFFHIVDSRRYARAISNVSALLKDKGYFLYSDYFMRGDEKRMEHIVFRNLQMTDACMRAHNLVEVTRLSVFYMMNSPVVTTQRFPRIVFRNLLSYAGRGEVWGRVLGTAAYPWELMLLNLAREPTGTELVVYQKNGERT